MNAKRPPVCRACPSCGSSVGKKVRSDRLFTFSGDRRCTRCASFYTPPTPKWVAWLFLAIGALLMVKTVFGVVAVLTSAPEVASDADEMGAGMWVCLGLVTLTGLFSLWQGVRFFREKQVEPPTYATGQDGGE
ncbi:hypothetical protein OT109_13720 [Phycisphaeraceae bacterium D3-23]